MNGIWLILFFVALSVDITRLPKEKVSPSSLDIGEVEEFKVTCSRRGETTRRAFSFKSIWILYTSIPLYIYIYLSPLSAINII